MMLAWMAAHMRTTTQARAGGAFEEETAGWDHLSSRGKFEKCLAVVLDPSRDLLALHSCVCVSLCLCLCAYQCVDIRICMCISVSLCLSLSLSLCLSLSLSLCLSLSLSLSLLSVFLTDYLIYESYVILSIVRGNPINQSIK